MFSINIYKHITIRKLILQFFRRYVVMKFITQAECINFITSGYDNYYVYTPTIYLYKQNKVLAFLLTHG